MATSTLKLSLVENSHTFMAEAARKAIAARDDIGQWQFAILNLVQAVELSLKELLRRQHPVLIFSDVGSPRNTVSLEQALTRIQNPLIGGITIPPDEKLKIKKAAELRTDQLLRR